MSRVTRGTVKVKRRRALRQRVKGFKLGRKKLTRLAKTADTKAGAHAYVGRKLKKRNARSLWQIRINAAVRELGLTYSTFMAKLKKSNVELDRKILADLAVNNKKIFKSIVDVIKK